MIESTTWEESPIKISEWIRQRSRWIKGHLQTYFVHMRNPVKFYKRVGPIGFMGVQFFLGAPALIFFISPFMWLAWVLFVTGFLQMSDTMPIWFFYVVNFSSIILGVGLVLHVLYAFCAVKYRKFENMNFYILLFPFYWILHSAASFKSVWQLITKPYYWEKTNHGEQSVKNKK